MRATAELQNVTVTYGEVIALDSVGLAVEEASTLAVLGPSGSGKTTLLHTIAGFLHPYRGEVFVAGRRVASPGRGEPPERRPVAMMFQHYALWPHMTALDNVAYPFRRQGHGRTQARRAAGRLLERLEIGELADRPPAELSGGQQQRVGLARALAREAQVFLFDEPTAHLDAALRQAVQEEIADRRRRSGAAAVYATHDAAEALAIAEGIALFRSGRIVQVGTPAAVYEEPVDLWAALLTGPASVASVPVIDVRGETVSIAVGEGTATIPRAGVDRTGVQQMLIRPEWVSLGGELPGVVEAVWYRGPHTDYRLTTPIGSIDVRQPGRPVCGAGDRQGWSLRRAWPLAEGTPLADGA